MNGESFVPAGVAAEPEVGPAAPPPEDEQLLELQRMESALVRADLEHPDTIDPAELRRLRYLLRLAHVTDFQPGAAERRRPPPDRPEVSLGGELARFRSEVIDALRSALR